MEVGGVAAAPGEKKEVAWFEHAAKIAQATRGGDLVFASGCSGIRGPDGKPIGELCNDFRGQVRQALRNVEAALARFGVGPGLTLRLDAYVRNIYAEEELVAELREAFGGNAPAISVMGGAPADGAEVEFSVIAGTGWG